MNGMGKIRKLIKIPFIVFDDILRFFITYLPGPTGRKIRYLYWKKKFKRCGKNVIIDEGVIIQNPKDISIGDNVWIDKYCVLMAGKVDLKRKIYKRRENKDFIGEEGELIIGNNFHIAPFCIIQAHGGVYIGDNSGLSSGVKIYSLSNLPNNPKDSQDIIYFTPMIDKSAYFIGPVVLKENVGVALNSIILGGVTIGKNSFVAPYSLVLYDIPENSYASGNPAKRIKERFSKGANYE